jgi:hypothetical protein
MMSTAIDHITLVCAGIVLFASFCRLTKTSVRTHASVRLGISLIAGASIFALVAPFLWQWNPDLIHLAIFAGMAVHQIATRKAWQHVPHWFQYER